MAKKGGRSHYSGPGKGQKEAPVAKSRMQLKAAKQAHGKGGPPPASPAVPTNRWPPQASFQLGKPATASSL